VEITRVQLAAEDRQASFGHVRRRGSR
jgi:hypothetical protein